MAEPNFLYVSDDPERFTQHGRLFHAALPSDGSTIRLLFDHVNGGGTPMRVVAGVYNRSPLASHLTAMGACAGPDANGMNVGHLATLRFLQAHEVIGGSATFSQQVQPAGSTTLADYVLQPGQCLAGIFDLSSTAGSACEVRVIACDPMHDQLNVFSLLPEAIRDGKDRRGIFDVTGMSTDVDLSYAGVLITALIGSQACPRATTDSYGGAPYAGGYGILRKFAISAQSDAFVFQSARGGSATASYIINGALWASHQIPAGPRFKVRAIQAGEALSFVTMAEINSSYPLALSLDQDDPTIADVGSPESPMYQT